MNDQPFQRPDVLVTYLDNSLLPRPDNEADRAALNSLIDVQAHQECVLIYASQQNVSTARALIEQHALPRPAWLLCDAGASVYRSKTNRSGSAYEPYADPLQTADDNGIVRAVKWLARRHEWATQSIVVAGQSVHGLPLLTDGFKTILVSNVEPELARVVWQAHRRQGWTDRVFFSTRGHATGLLQGLQWFEMVPHETPYRPERLGATPVSLHRTFFRVWAPRCRRLAVHWNHDQQPATGTLQKHANGYFTGTLHSIGPGTDYRLAADERPARPDPASYFQPDGVHGPSQVVTEGNFPWTDQDWRGVAKRDLVIYELHVGTFTQQGTYAAAAQQLAELVDLGVTAVQLLPVAQTPGKWNWGYDGVNLFAPRNTYGSVNDLKLLVDRCHQLGLAVILDVVYNHLGPEGNYLSEFAPYFSRRHRTPWGEAFDYDGRNARAVRRFILENVRYWLSEFHLDGLRLDAVHFMFDDSERTILDEIRTEVSQVSMEHERTLHLIAEANIYDHRLVYGKSFQQDYQQAPPTKTEPYDAIWCDDLMHSIYTQAFRDLNLAHREYRGAVDLAEVLEYGFIYVGPVVKRADSQLRARLNLPQQRDYLHRFVVALQTHDSVGNHPHGKRIHQLTSVDFQMAAAALVLLYPSIPLIFMGEERAASSPFPFFVDFQNPVLRDQVDRGRAAEYPQHAWQGAPPPSDPDTFYRAKYCSNTANNESVFRWYRALLSWRRQLLVSGLLRPDNLKTESRLEADCFALHYASERDSVSVLTRLQSEVDHPAAIFELTGCLLLDSTQPSHNKLPPHDALGEYTSQRFVLAPCQSIVVYRRFT